MGIGSLSFIQINQQHETNAEIKDLRSNIQDLKTKGLGLEVVIKELRSEIQDLKTRLSGLEAGAVAGAVPSTLSSPLKA